MATDEEKDWWQRKCDEEDDRNHDANRDAEIARLTSELAAAREDAVKAAQEIADGEEESILLCRKLERVEAQLAEAQRETTDAFERKDVLLKQVTAERDAAVEEMRDEAGKCATAQAERDRANERASILEKRLAESEAACAAMSGLLTARVREVSRRLVAAGNKAEHVSASECHEITNAVVAACGLLASPNPGARILAELEALRELEKLAPSLIYQPTEYDFSDEGGSPEEMGWMCQMCGMGASNAANIAHDLECQLLALDKALAAVSAARGDGS